MKAKGYKPMGWQREARHLITAQVQYWSNGIMMTLLPLSEAKGLVIEDKAFVITSQAIGRLENGIAKA